MLCGRVVPAAKASAAAFLAPEVQAERRMELDADATLAVPHGALASLDRSGRMLAAHRQPVGRCDAQMIDGRPTPLG